MSGGSDFEMLKTQLFYILEDLKTKTNSESTKNEIWDIQKQINRLDEYDNGKRKSENQNDSN